MELNNVRNSESVLQCHFGFDPNEREGTSVMALSTPKMCNGISGDVFESCRRKAKARINCMATLECFAAKRWTQCTVGLLSLKSATCALATVGQTSSITIHRSKSPAISRSEFVMRPFGFVSETSSVEVSIGHWIRKTVGGTARFSPMIMPPAPCAPASVIPT